MVETLDAGAKARSTWRNRWNNFRTLLEHPKVMFLIAPTLLGLSIIVLIGGTQHETFLAAAQSIVPRIIKDGTPLALLAIGAGLVLSTGGVDISTAGVATVGGVVFAGAVQLGAPLWGGLVAGLLVGAVSGTLLGYIVVRFHAPSLIASWAVGALWSVCALLLAGTAGNISFVKIGVEFPSNWWSWNGPGTYTSVITLFLTIYFLNIANIPLRARATGADHDSAVYAGIPTKRIVLYCYACSGVAAALAGCMWAVINRGASTTDLFGRELVAIAVAVLGGTVMSGGYLSLGSIASAAYFWQVTNLFVLSRNLTQFRQKQAYIASALFALLFLALMIPLGRRLSGHTRSVHIEQKT